MNDATINFNNLLKQALEKESKNEDICMITFEPLVKPIIKLKCNHSFNYDAILKEVKKQKLFINKAEVQKLNYFSIKCPYCRTVQNKLLPYFSGEKKIKSVNWPKTLCMNYEYDKCQYTFLSGKNKGSLCEKDCLGKYCSKHKKILKKREEAKKEKMLDAFVINKIQNEVVENEVVENEVVDVVENAIVDKVSPILTTCFPVRFKATCCHTFKRGKSKGQICEKRIYVYPTDQGNFMYSNYYCSQHKKCKNNTSELLETPKCISIRVSEKIKKMIPDKYYKNFIKTYYTYYYNNPNYNFNKNTQQFVLHNGS